MDYVGEKSAAKARELEKILQQLSPNAGIIFVSIAAIPVEGGDSEVFDVIVGTKRGIEAGVALVQFAFREEIKQGLKFVIQSVQGVSGASRDSGDAEVGTPSA